MKTVLSHANLIDCVEPKVRPDCAVLIEDGRIRAILPSGEAGSAGDALMIDLKGGYLMPGLWDVHIHPDTCRSTRCRSPIRLPCSATGLRPRLPNPAFVGLAGVRPENRRSRMRARRLILCPRLLQPSFAAVSRCASFRAVVAA